MPESGRDVVRAPGSPVRGKGLPMAGPNRARATYVRASAGFRARATVSHRHLRSRRESGAFPNFT